MTIFLLIFVIAIVAAGFFFGLSEWRRVGDYESRLTGQSVLPKMSVIAYVHRDEENLNEYIDALLSQDYPDYEVILVCDASAEASAMLSEKFEDVKNLHITFIPPGSHNLSRRKLAQTLGIKRASGQIVVTTSTSVLPRSNQWLRSMAEPFADNGVDIVCGYVHPEIKDFAPATRLYRQMDSVLTAAQWMNAAIQGHTYRGDGYNLAFRRHLFFERKGYASSLTLVDGDDDIFVNELASSGEGRLVLSPDSMVDTRWKDEADRMYIEYKDRYNFTRKYLPKAPFIKASIMSWVIWLSLPAIIGIILEACSHFTTSAAVSNAPFPTADITLLALSAIGVLGFWTSIIIFYRRLAARLEATKLLWSILPFMLWRPIGNTLFFLNHYPSRKVHYTWVRN